MKLIPVFCGLLFLASPALGEVQRITLYLDGARVEREIAVEYGHADVKLPGTMVAGSLRIKPLRGGELVRVELVPPARDRKRSRELSRLSERVDELNDRLKALDVREEIFRAAAKAQSGKTPRKTKTSREPLDDMRKGTDFAFARLESVYRARRTTDRELKAVTARLSSLGNGATGAGSVARVDVAGKNSRILVSYFDTVLKWKPSYDFKVGSGNVEIAVNARFPMISPGTAVAVVPALHGSGAASGMFPANTGPFARIATFRLPLEKEMYSAKPASTLVFSVRNSSGISFPPGEASCYRQGEYLGTIPFGGSRPEETSELVCGQDSLTAEQQVSKPSSAP